MANLSLTLAAQLLVRRIQDSGRTGERPQQNPSIPFEDETFWLFTRWAAQRRSIKRARALSAAHARRDTDTHKDTHDAPLDRCAPLPQMSA